VSMNSGQEITPTQNDVVEIQHPTESQHDNPLEINANKESKESPTIISTSKGESSRQNADTKEGSTQAFGKEERKNPVDTENESSEVITPIKNRPSSKQIDRNKALNNSATESTDAKANSIGTKEQDKRGVVAASQKQKTVQGQSNTPKESTTKNVSIRAQNDSIATQDRIKIGTEKKGSKNEGAEEQIAISNKEPIGKSIGANLIAQTDGNTLPSDTNLDVPEGEKKEEMVDSTTQSEPVPEVVAEIIAATDSSEESTSDSSKTRHRKFKMSIGILSIHQIGNTYAYDYNSLFSYTLQSKIKYPLFSKKFQLNTGIDYTAGQHHFFRTEGGGGDFDEVNEIHLALKRIELPVSLDYKLPVSSVLEYRVGAGLKFSKIFSDEEVALNEEGDEVFHPEDDNSFLVDGLAPVLTNKFVYFNVSKDIKKIRANFQLYYYFKQWQMDDTHSETFVSEYFNVSSIRVGFSVDF
jgi:hypothetical protein